MTLQGENFMRLPPGGPKHFVAASSIANTIVVVNVKHDSFEEGAFLTGLKGHNIPLKCNSFCHCHNPCVQIYVHNNRFRETDNNS